MGGWCGMVWHASVVFVLLLELLQTDGLSGHDFLVCQGGPCASAVVGLTEALNCKEFFKCSSASSGRQYVCSSTVAYTLDTVLPFRLGRLEPLSNTTSLGWYPSWHAMTARQSSRTMSR